MLLTVLQRLKELFGKNMASPEFENQRAALALVLHQTLDGIFQLQNLAHTDGGNENDEFLSMCFHGIDELDCLRPYNEAMRADIEETLGNYIDDLTEWCRDIGLDQFTAVENPPQSRISEVGMNAARQ